MKIKSNRIHGIVGSVLLVLAMSLVAFKSDKVVKNQNQTTRIHKGSQKKETVILQQEKTTSESKKEFVFDLELKPSFPEN